MITVQYIIVYDPGCYTTRINKFTYSPMSRRLSGKYIIVKYNNYNICTVGVGVAIYQSKGFAVRDGILLYSTIQYMYSTIHTVQ
jgi:hypothetical protein